MKTGRKSEHSKLHSNNQSEEVKRRIGEKARQRMMGISPTKGRKLKIVDGRRHYIKEEL
jgi:hypothetical protein